ncbi:MAG: peptide chain release factor N(5)-glutamine methyltransferase [Leucobacter sp.]
MSEIGAVLGLLRARLEEAGIADPAPDAELIVGHVLGVSRGRVQALALLGRELTAEQLGRIEELAGERARRVPLQHLTGRAPFRSLELSVGPGVFVPRPETETVAQFAIDSLQLVPSANPVAADLCTGSGAIALAIANEVATARVWAVEKSPEAHAWASRNTAEWGQGRVELLLGDALDPELLAHLSAGVDVLVSNPPYVPLDMVPRDPEVRDHDPELALYSGADGLDLIRGISKVGLDLVRPGGLIVLEHAETQGEAIRRLLTADGWSAAATHRDLTGLDRATTAVR